MRKHILYYLFILTLFACSSTKENEKPNILWITLEDTSPQFLATYGCNIATTPTMDKLGEEGIVFRNAYATGAVCSSSRSTIITGCPTEVLGTGNHRSNYAIPSFIKGFPYYLKEAGYYTSNNVKTDYNIQNEKNFIEETWDESSSEAGWWRRAEDQPFFSVFNFIDCHQSRTMTKPWLWYEETILDELPDSLKISPEEIEMPPFYHNTKEMRKHVSRVHNSLRKTDIDVAKLLARLEEEGLKENTIIFIYADHGEGIPRGKCHSIGFGHRVPFYIWFPEKYKHLSPWGTQMVTDELISFEDLAPTLLSLAGCEIPEHMNGRPFMGEKRQEPRPFVYGARNRLDDTPGLERTVFDGRFVYSRNFYPRLPVQRYQKYADVSDIVKTIREDAALGKLNEIQEELVKQPRPAEYLYDLHNDVWETENLAENPDFQNDLERLREAAKNRIIELNDIHFIPEKLMLDRAEGSTAYEIRKNKSLNPIDEILQVADLVGREKNPETFLSLLKSEKEEIRFWAAVGLNHLENNLPETEKLLPFLNDSSDFVRIEIATILYKTTKNKEAKKILDAMIVGENLFAAHHALQQILYLPELANDFIPTVKTVKERYTETNKKGFNYPVQNSSEMFLYVYNNEPLYYSGDKPWIPELKE